MGNAENAVMLQVRLAIVQAGTAATFVRVQAGSFRINDRFIRGAEAGTADYLGAYRGTPVAIEVKTATGKQSPTQRDWAERWRAAGGVYALVRSYEEAVELFRWLDHAIHKGQ
jgi:hypothetical protein